jgi:tyrosyl-tRNA synthetase
MKLGFASSKTECRKLIQSGAAKRNDEKISDINLRLSAEDLAEPVKLSMGKKKHGLVALE